MIDKIKLQVAIGQRIKALRESKEISQKELAESCGIDKPNLSRLESGGTNPTLYTLQLVADKLGITLKELVDFNSHK